MNNKITRSKLIDLYKADTCSAWRNTIEGILSKHPLASDDSIFTIEDKYIKKLIDEGSDRQKKLVESAGIEITPLHTRWTREVEFIKGNYYYLNRALNEGFSPRHGDNLTVSKAHTYETRELAEKEAKLFSLMQLMRSWARHHNKIDGFVADWNRVTDKWGLLLFEGKVRIETWSTYNTFLAQAAVSSKQRAKEMLEEFKDDIEVVDFNC